jgi:aspartate kinase
VGGATDLTFTVKRTDLDRARQVVEEVARELGGGEVVTASDLAKLSIVGTGMLDATGYASKMFRTLSDNEINIEMITTSEIRITCIVAEVQLDRAARALHSAFDLDGPE